MIITKICGGLGNQLFQYCLGRSLSVRHKTDLYLDLSFFNNDKNIHPLSLIHLNLNYKIATKKEYNSILMRDRGWLMWKINNQYQKFLKYNSKSYVQEKINYFDEDILRLKNNTILDGYWQSSKYFYEIEHILRKEITLKQESENPNYKLLKETIIQNGLISVHVRRGDYLNHNVPLCSIDYYNKAMEKISATTCNPVFIIFSDDIEWCKLNFYQNFKYIYVEKQYGLFDYEELMLMSYCKNNIIANSTYSWWAGWLNTNIDKKVIYPLIAFVMLNRDLMLPEWIGL